MDDIFRVGDAHFTFSVDSHVSFVDGGMQFELKAAPVAFDAAVHAPAFAPDEWRNPEPGLIAPTLRSGDFSFYDRHDSPRRTIAWPRDYSIEDDFYLWVDGFAFGHGEFRGTVTVDVDMLELRGRMVGGSWSADDDGVPIHVRRCFTPGHVERKPHTYTSLDELRDVLPERVRVIRLHGHHGSASPPLTAFPDDVLRFANLESLSLDWLSGRGLDLPELPDALCDLSELRHLWIDGAPLQRLPARIGQLRRLERLGIRSGQLTALPDGIGDLAALNLLDLSGNRLESLPSTIAGLTSLERCELAGNRLATVPDCIGGLPALRVLDLERNPFVSLPASLSRVPGLKLEQQHQALFRDIRYRPDIDADLDPGQFLARSSDTLLAALDAGLQRHGLAHVREPLLRHARRALRWRLTPLDGAAPAIGATRFGGAPDLPPDVGYPRSADGKHWLFYAQLELASIAPLQDWLPRSGRLYVFMDNEETFTARVIHSDADAGTLVPYLYPDDVEFEDGNIDEPFRTCRADVSQVVSLPNLYNGEDRYTGDDAVLMAIEDDDDTQRAYRALAEALLHGEALDEGARRPRDHVSNGFVFTQHESPEEQAASARDGLPDEWINLLMLDSDDAAGFQFWDAGTLTFSIHRRMLAVGDFSDVVVSLESS